MSAGASSDAQQKYTAGGVFYGFAPDEPNLPRFYFHLHGPMKFSSDEDAAGQAVFSVTDEAIRQNRLLNSKGKKFDYLH
jgi:hypothetical protein